MMTEKFNIGDWITYDSNIMQIIYIRPFYVEKFTQEYFEGKKLGSKLYSLLICKILCSIDGKIKKNSRIIAANSDYCNIASKKSIKIIEEIKSNKEGDYENYLTYDDERDIGESLVLKLNISVNDFKKVNDEIVYINKKLNGPFTFKKFIKVAKENNFSINIDNELKNGPLFETNFSIVFFNRLYKVVNKQRVYTKVWCDY